MIASCCYTAHLVALAALLEMIWERWRSPSWKTGVVDTVPVQSVAVVVPAAVRISGQQWIAQAVHYEPLDNSEKCMALFDMPISLLM